MKHSGSLTVLVGVAAAVLCAAPADAATGPLQIPGFSGRVPAEVGFPLAAGWRHPAFPGPAPPSTDGRYELRTALPDGTSCVRGAIVVAVAVRPADRPVLKGSTLRLRAEGSLLPRMQVERHGTAGGLSWFAGPLHESPAVREGVAPPLQQGIAVLPAPRWATHVGRSLIVVRVLLDARVDSTAATLAEADACFGPLRARLGPDLRAILRGLSVRRRPSAAS